MNQEIAALVLADTVREFANQRGLAERAIAQLTDDDLFRATDAEANSVAIIMKHIGGNLRSRWTDFLTSDGEKPNRNRDGEFLSDNETRASITETWTAGWDTLDATLRALQPGDLSGSVTIRGVSLPVIEAIHRSLAHTAQHVGQIIILARQLRGSAWQTLSIPRGRSAEYLSRPPA